MSHMQCRCTVNTSLKTNLYPTRRHTKLKWKLHVVTSESVFKIVSFKNHYTQSIFLNTKTRATEGLIENFVFKSVYHKCTLLTYLLEYKKGTTSCGGWIFVFNCARVQGCNSYSLWRGRGRGGCVEGGRWKLCLGGYLRAPSPSLSPYQTQHTLILRLLRHISSYM